MEKRKIIKYEDIKDKVEELVSMTNEEYNKKFNDARMQTARVMVERFLSKKPDASEEEVQEYIDNYLKQTPDEFQRNLRTVTEMGGCLFNLGSAILNEMMDFKSLFVAINKQKLEAISKKMIKEQQEMAERQSEPSVKYEPSEETK